MGLTNAWNAIIEHEIHMEYRRYLITLANRDGLSNNMATGKFSKGSPIRVQSKLTVINVSFSAFIFRPVLDRLLML